MLLKSSRASLALIFHNTDSGPSTYASCPTILIPLSPPPFLSPSPPLFFLPPASVLTVLKCRPFALYQSSICTLYSQRPPPPSLPERRGTHFWGAGGSPLSQRIHFPCCRAILWLMFSKHTSLVVKQYEKHC